MTGPTARPARHNPPGATAENRDRPPHAETGVGAGTAPATVGISIRGLAKTFTRRNGEKVKAIDQISIDVAQGEFLVLLGPSGCGKTTLLRVIAGLEHAEAGRIVIDGTPVYDRDGKIDIPPEARPASMVFQSYALWPHMTAVDNVAYPLRSRAVGKSEARQRAEAVLETVGIGQVRDQLPAQMSGGQQQRVALARAIAAGENTILFDEPLSNVDAKVRDRLRLEILRMQRELGFTAVYVTHDQEEAMTLGTRIAVLEAGRIAQLGRPRDVYEQPASRYAANFVGAADEIEARVVGSDGADVVVDTAVGRLRTRAREALAPGAPAVLVVRPERWQMHLGPVQAANAVSGVVEASLFLGGARMEYVVRLGEVSVRIWDYQGRDLAPGTAVTLTVEPGNLLLFPAG